MLRYQDLHIKIATWPTTLAWLPLASHLEALAIVDTGRDFNLQARFLRLESRTRTLLTWILD
jgi:hypothetical protein